jgi:uncharacterized membrane protein YphA (DoxX/SURF4 family)
MEVRIKMDERLNRTWWVLRIGSGVGPILAGSDKFFNLLTNWEMYLNPLAPKLLHLQPTTFMHIAGVVEIAVGVAVLTKYTRYAAYVVMIWLWCIAANLVSQATFFDVAVRDIEISLGAFVLAKLSEVRATATRRSTQGALLGSVRRSAA